MNGNCHFIFGASVGTAVCLWALPDAVTATALISTCLIGSVFPDIDNPSSSFGNLTKPVSTVIGKVGESVGKSGYNHRGLLHDMALYTVGLIMCYLYFPSGIGFFIGALSHLFLDAFNPMGIPVLFGAFRLRFARIKSGSKESVALSWLLSVAVIVTGSVLIYGKGKGFI